MSWTPATGIATPSARLATPSGVAAAKETTASQPSQERQEEGVSLRSHRCANGTRIEIAVRDNPSGEDKPTSFGWAAGTFLRGGYNPADAASMDSLLQAGWREVGTLSGDETSQALMRGGDVLVFRNSEGAIESVACYEGQGFFSYVKDGESAPRFEAQEDFLHSHSDAIERGGVSIMREVNPYRHRVLAETARPLLQELHGMESSSRIMEDWPPKLRLAVEGLVFDRMGKYQTNVSHDISKPPDAKGLLPKAAFLAQLHKDVALFGDLDLPAETIDKYGDDIREATAQHRRRFWVYARMRDIGLEHLGNKVSEKDLSAKAWSDPRALEFVRRAGVANCQETSALLCHRLREVAGNIPVEVIGQKEQDGTDHIYVAIGRDAHRDVRKPWKWNADTLLVDGWRGYIRPVGEVFGAEPMASPHGLRA